MAMKNELHNDSFTAVKNEFHNSFMAGKNELHTSFMAMKTELHMIISQP